MNWVEVVGQTLGGGYDGTGLSTGTSYLYILLEACQRVRSTRAREARRARRTSTSRSNAHTPAIKSYITEGGVGVLRRGGGVEGGRGICSDDQERDALGGQNARGGIKLRAASLGEVRAAGRGIKRERALVLNTPNPLLSSLLCYTNASLHDRDSYLLNFSMMG